MTVEAGRGQQRQGESAYEIDPGEREAYTWLLAELEREGRLPERLVHLWSTEASEPGQQRAQQLGFFSLLFLSQALSALPGSAPRHLDVISTGVQSVSGHEELCPDKATVLGPCRVLPQELPGFSCKSIDIELPAQAERLESLAGRLLIELSGLAQSAVLAYRGIHRWEQAFESIRMPQAPASSRLRRQGTYLISGGLGGIGLVLAEHLARKVQARLVLVSRSALPPRHEWQQWQAQHGEQDPVSQRLRRLQELEALGSQVLVLSADVGSAEQMAEVLHKAREAFGELHGVIHAAGVPAGGLSQLRTPQGVEEVFRPKVKGTQVLVRLLESSPLDFFLLCSSRTAFVGEFGQVDHCAASAFLDALAHQYATVGHPLPVRALNWDTWREVGQAVTTQLPAGLQHLREQLLAHALTSAEGVDVFERALEAALPQLIVSTQDLPAVLARGGNTLQDLTGTSEPEPQGAAAQASTPREAGEIEQMLANVWRRLLGVEHVNPHDNFFDLGGNSLIGLKVIAEVKRSLGVELPAVSLFENPTIGSLARLLSRRQAQGQGEQEAAPSLAGRQSRARRRERLLQKLQTE